MNGPHLHPCSVPGCGKLQPPHLLMCKRHWFQVPGGLRQTVLNAWAAWQRGDIGRDVLREAQDAATQAVPGAIEGGAL